MCKGCGYKFGSTRHLLYWLKHFIVNKDFSKAKKTLYHLVNRKAHREWFNKKNELKALQLSFLLVSEGCTEAPDEYVDWLSEQEPIDLFNDYYEELK